MLLPGKRTAGTRTATMNKVILVVCDALRDDTAAAQMGYLEHLVEAKQASRFTVRGQGNTYSMVSQLQIAPTLCRLLGIPVPATMVERPIEDGAAD